MIDRKRTERDGPIRIGQRWRNLSTGRVWVIVRQDGGRWLIRRQQRAGKTHHIHEGTLRKYNERVP